MRFGRKYWLWLGCGTVALLAALAAYLFLACGEQLCYEQGLRTFYYDQSALSEILHGKKGGLLAVVGLFFIQFFTTSLHGAIVSAAIATAAGIVLALMLTLIFRRGWVAAVGAVPVVLLAVLLSSPVTATDMPSKEYCRLSNMLQRGDFDGALALCSRIDMGADPRFDNMRALALAQNGTLGSELFHERCSGVPTLTYNEPTPDTFALLSDIYYAMGHISLARYYAFQANEALGNYSPRMLQRLIDTNLIYGEGEVARKYLRLLAATHGYSEWAKDREALIGNDLALAQHPELGSKRQCVIASDRFIGINGIADDLLQIALANPQHQATVQYLGSMLLLKKDLPGFVKALDTLYGAGILQMPLPVHFQEAVAAAALASGDRIDIKYGVPESMMVQCQGFWSGRMAAPGTVWTYLKK